MLEPVKEIKEEEAEIEEAVTEEVETEEVVEIAEMKEDVRQDSKKLYFCTAFSKTVKKNRF